MEILRTVLSFSVLVGIAYLFCGHRKAINWRLVGSGLLLQLALGLIILKIGIVADIVKYVSRAFVKFLSFATDGAAFIFGDLALDSTMQEGVGHSMGFILAFQVLPIIVYFSAFVSALYYLGILQKIVYGFAFLMARTMRLSGPESLCAAGNVFLGMTEAPLLVKPLLGRMSQSELMCLMTGGLATISGTVLGVYVAFLGGSIAEEQTLFTSYLLTASIMNAPAAIVFAKIIIPETCATTLDGNLKISREGIGINLLDALTIGIQDGLKMAVNVGAMLLAFIALIALVNAFLGGFVGDLPIGSLTLNEWIAQSTNNTFEGFSLEYIFGQIFRWIAWLIGVPWQDTLSIGSLLGQKTALNEFIAYLNLGELKAAGFLQEKSIIIASYALCGFSNFSSIAILIGGISALVPARQKDLSRLGLKALLAATLACLTTGSLAGLII